MSLQITLNGLATGNVYIGWTPRPCSLRFTPAQPQSATVTLVCVTRPGGGQVMFSPNATTRPVATLQLAVQGNGTPVNFFIAGTKASTADQDATVEVRDGSGAVLARRTVMVRIRKNANSLTARERDLFLDAIVRLNQSTGIPNYTTFREMHNEAADAEIHTSQFGTRFSFLPWHRAYILDVERRLQAINPAVSLPYWKFDEAAPNVFTADFMGEERPSGTVRLNTTNPLSRWRIGTRPGIVRTPWTNLRSAAGTIPNAPPITTEAGTMALGTTFANFRRMEFNPHGYAHSVFRPGAPITNPATAPEDPLFFMLHCNVDRLWALWQKNLNRFDATNTATYPVQGTFTPNPNSRVGDFLNDTMWPWNDQVRSANSTRPPTAPGGQFPQLNVPATPSAIPILRETIDYQALRGGQPNYADYDRIPFFPGLSGFLETAEGTAEDAITRAMEKNKNFTERVKIAEMAEMDDILNEQDQVDPGDEEATKKLRAVITNKAASTSPRLKALKAVNNALFENEAAVRDTINLITDADEPLEIRRAALHSLISVRFASPALKALMPEFKQALRKLLDSHDPELVQLAAEILASEKDEAVQSMLVDQLRSNADGAIPKEKAIQLLSLDIRGDFLPVIRDVLAKTKDPNVQVEAIMALSNDPQSQELIVNKLEDKTSHQDVRMASIMALNSGDAKQATSILKNIVSDQTESDALRTASLGALTSQPNLGDVQKDDTFNTKVQELGDSGSEEMQKATTRYFATMNKSKDSEQ